MNIQEVASQLQQRSDVENQIAEGSAQSDYASGYHAGRADGLRESIGVMDRNAHQWQPGITVWFEQWRLVPDGDAGYYWMSDPRYYDGAVYLIHFDMTDGLMDKSYMRVVAGPKTMFMKADVPEKPKGV